MSYDLYVIFSTKPSGPCLMPYYFPDTAPARLSYLESSMGPYEDTRSGISSNPIFLLSEAHIANTSSLITSLIPDYVNYELPSV